MRIWHDEAEGVQKISLTNEEVVRLLAEGLHRNFAALQPTNQGGHGVSLSCDYEAGGVLNFVLTVDPR